MTQWHKGDEQKSTYDSERREQDLTTCNTQTYLSRLVLLRASRIAKDVGLYAPLSLGAVVLLVLGLTALALLRPQLFDKAIVFWKKNSWMK